MVKHDASTASVNTLFFAWEAKTGYRTVREAVPRVRWARGNEFGACLEVEPSFKCYREQRQIAGMLNAEEASTLTNVAKPTKAAAVKKTGMWMARKKAADLKCTDRHCVLSDLRLQL